MNYNISKEAFNRIRSICYNYHLKNKQHYQHKMILNELKVRVFISRLFMHKTYPEISEQFGISRYQGHSYYKELVLGLYNSANPYDNKTNFKTKERYVYDNLREFL